MGRREQIRELLQLFASEEEQLEYERNVPHVDITVELVCMWFDDQYLPKLRHFENCFKRVELAALEEFNSFYDSKIQELPESNGTVKTWLANPAWKEIMKRAKETLEVVNA